MTKPLTDQQRRAVTHHPGSVVLASGAGCGKTSVLTERYLWYLIDRGADVSRLVAITFTDKAAREMRKRIREAIEKREKETTGAERERWRAQLRALETAEINTIHTFCGNLLRRHALAADLDPGFQILDRAVADSLLVNAVRDGLSRLLTEASPAGDSLRSLIRLYGWSKIRREIPDLVAAGGDWADHLSLTTEGLIRRWHASIDECRRLAVDYYRRRLSLDDAIQRLRRLRPTGPKLRDNLNTLFDCWQSLDACKDLAGQLMTISGVARVQGTEQKKAFADTDDYELCKNTLALFREEFCKKLADIAAEAPDMTEAATVSLDFLRVADACRAEYDRTKEQHGGLDFDDLLLRAHDLLRTRPDICMTSSDRIQYLLVDELQDTDPVQMDIVRSLCGDVGGGKLFAVGDAKQSIYRFRGAAVDQFEELRQEVASGHSLTQNFRSRRELLDFVNALFKDDLPNYEPLTAGLPAPAADRCVEFLWGTQEGLLTRDAREREARRIARRIKEMIEHKEKLVVDRQNDQPELRAVKSQDVVLLFRSMSNVMYYESALRDHGLNYYLVGGRAFYAQQEIFDIANLLRTLENPNDSVALVGVLRSPFGCLSDDALVILATHKEGYWAAIQDQQLRDQLPSDDQKAAGRLAGWLPHWREVKDQLTIAQLMARVVADTGYDAALRFEFLGDRKVANLWKLMEEARTFDRAGQRVADFIEHLDRMIEGKLREEQAATQPEKSEVIRLMSIHQAKGLEFPVVFLPDLNASVGSSHSPLCRFDRDFGPVVLPPKEDGEYLFTDYPLTLWKARELCDEWHESLRVFYVACTRAANYLVLSGSLTDPLSAQSPAMRLLSERFDINDGASRKGASVAVRVQWPGDHPLPETKPASAKEDSISPDDIQTLTSPDCPPNSDEPPRWLWLFRQVLGQWDITVEGGWRAILKALGASAADRGRFERFVRSVPVQQFLAADDRQVGVVAATADGARADLDLLWKDASGWHALCLDGVSPDAVKQRLRERMDSLEIVGL